MCPRNDGSSERVWGHETRDLSRTLKVRDARLGECRPKSSAPDIVRVRVGLAIASKDACLDVEMKPAGGRQGTRPKAQRRDGDRTRGIAEGANHKIPVNCLNRRTRTVEPASPSLQPPREVEGATGVTHRTHSSRPAGREARRPPHTGSARPTPSSSSSSPSEVSTSPESPKSSWSPTM
mmetsp:Transcript_102285/g.220783  ORF Transcript_102285/g.220783 Transcript_102285/m.220783 type:complete len:179 (-) Transcript_102285:953-1489(-)